MGGRYACMPERVSPGDVNEDNPFPVIECVHPVDDVYDIVDGVVSASVLRLMILIYGGLRCLSFLVPSCPLYTSFILPMVHSSTSWFMVLVHRARSRHSCE